MAVYANISADQGTSFSATVTVTSSNGVDAADLTGYTAAAQARRTYTSSTSYPFVAVINTPSETMKGRYLYDVEVTDGSGIITRVIEGQFEVGPGITR